MRRLECGCELSADGNHFLSLCDTHGQHVRTRLEAAKHPRARETPNDKAFERELVKILAPVVFQRDIARAIPIDPETCAEKLFQCVQAITRRME